MSEVTFKGQPIKLIGQLPSVGQSAPDFKLLRPDLSEVSLASYPGKKKILNIVVSVDTAVCALSVKKFYQRASEQPNLVVLNISADLPFAIGRFCGAEGLKSVEGLSAFRSSFGKDYGLMISQGPLRDLYARAVVVVDENNKVLYEELVPEIAQEPNYDKALEAAR